MSIFDLIANDMRNSFTDEADLTPYSAVQAQHDLFELNRRRLRFPGRRALRAGFGADEVVVPDAAPPSG